MVSPEFRIQGGGLFIGTNGIVSFSLAKKSKSSAAVEIVSNAAISDLNGAGFGGAGGNATGGDGGNGTTGHGENGGTATAGNGGNGAAADGAEGGGVFNEGDASFNGVTVNITSNQANGQFQFEGKSETGGVGGDGGDGGGATGGTGGNDNGDGGDAIAGNGGNAGEGCVGLGGGLINVATGTLSMNPQLGAPEEIETGEGHRPHLEQPGRQRSGRRRGAPGPALRGVQGAGGSGVIGTSTQGAEGTVDNSDSQGIGGGAAFITGGSATLDNVTISGNTASTSDPDVYGTFST